MRNTKKNACTGNVLNVFQQDDTRFSKMTRDSARWQEIQHNRRTCFTAIWNENKHDKQCNKQCNKHSGIGNRIKV